MTKDRRKKLARTPDTSNRAERWAPSTIAVAPHVPGAHTQEEWRAILDRIEMALQPVFERFERTVSP